MIVEESVVILVGFKDVNRAAHNILTKFAALCGRRAALGNEINFNFA